MSTLDGLIRLAIALVVVYIWTDDLLHAYRDWRSDRDVTPPAPREIAESLRSFQMAFVIWLGTVVLLAGAIAVLLPAFVAVSRFLAIMVSGSLIVVGLWVRVLWRRR